MKDAFIKSCVRMKNPSVSKLQSCWCVIPLILLLLASCGHLDNVPAGVRSPTDSIPDSVKSRAKTKSEKLVTEEINKFEVSSDWIIENRSIYGSKNLVSLHFLNESVGWVGGGGEIFKTMNAGSTWTQTAIPQCRNMTVSFIRFFNERDGWLVCEVPETEASSPDQYRSHILSTNSGGKDWKQMAEWPRVLVTDFYLSEDHGWITGFEHLGYDNVHHLRPILYRANLDKALEDSSGSIIASPKYLGVALMGASAQGNSCLNVLTSTGVVLESCDNTLSFREKYSIDSSRQSIRGFGTAFSGQLWMADATSGFEGTGSRFVILDETEDSVIIRKQLFPGLFFDSLVDLPSGGFISVVHGSCEEETESSCVASLLYRRSNTDSWVQVFESSALPGKELSVTKAGSSSVFALMSDQIFRLHSKVEN